MNMGTRSSYHHGDLRRALLDGAVVAIAEHGVAGFSLSALARSCAVSSAAPYRHFADRETLFAEIATDGYGRLRARLAAVGGADPEEVALGMVRAYLAFAREDGARHAVLSGGVCDRARFPGLREAGDAAFATLAAAVERAGGTAADATALWALAQGFANLAREGSWTDLPGAPPLEVAAVAAGRAQLAGARLRDGAGDARRAALAADEAPPLRIEPLAGHMRRAPQLARWHAAEWAHLLPGWSYGVALAELQTHTRPDGVPVSFVALEGDHLVGSVSLVWEDLPGWEHLRPWLASLYVRPASRGRGVARRLVAAVTEHARLSGLERLYLYTEGQAELYRGLGWSRLSSTELAGHTVTVMCRELGTG